jgi:hypothetical protein
MTLYNRVLALEGLLDTGPRGPEKSCDLFKIIQWFKGITEIGTQNPRLNPGLFLLHPTLLVFCFSKMI